MATLVMADPSIVQFKLIDLQHIPSHFKFPMASQPANKIVYEKARLYSDVNVRKGPNWYDYENDELDCVNPDDYEIVQKIGRGKYSEVFEGIDTRRDAKCVIKILKPIRGSKVKREVKVLRNLAGGPGVVQLGEVVRDPASKTTSLVFEYVNNRNYKQLYPELSVGDVSYYMFQILKCLDYCHTSGIMHRDIKPQNILIDPDTKTLKVIDWGLAQFYFPGKEYNVRVASRYFKGPELLVDSTYYDYSLDMWSLGATFAGIIFKKDPFFMGINNEDQLDKITKVLGTKQLMEYLKKYKLKLSSKYDNVLGKHPKKTFESFITEENKHLATLQAIDLLSKMLVYDHAARILPKQAMKHPLFKGLQ